ncbi:polysaccharide deacetylase family protein [Paenibacillus sp.]|uniref:polysaccharide deacetylase family protein n=1 Tax=Paenibacillus sp. TaxID=58172 RepID=UPI002D739253|nr:polysaccharide deacetylase family protein [Paenibacillus sp.]HZG84109.1 polysaccharide deacetylase family protein [Paenibacillus sp.]
MNTAERLGFGPEDRLLIINADDFGMCHATNEGIFRLLEEGAVDSATVMMPCGWSTEAVRWSASHPQFNVGVHFTLTSEWEGYKWGPVQRGGDVSSLVVTGGWFPADAAAVERTADPAHVRAELIAQLEAATALGLDPTHVDNHMGTVYGLATGRDFLREVFEVCASYRLPFRIPRRAPQDRGAPPELQRKAEQLGMFADSLGVAILDELVGLPFHKLPGETYDSFKRDMIALLRNLRPGVNELIIHPSLVTDELKAINPHWEKRGWEMDIFRDPEVLAAMSEAGIRRTRWSELRAMQRGER